MRILFILSGLAIGSVYSHPHEWINYLVTPEINVQGEIVALNEQWEFDPLAAEMILQPVLLAPTKAEQLQQMADLEKMVNETVGSQQYLTHAQEPIFATAEQRKLTVEEGVLYYRFRLPLKKPTKKIAYRIYEPSYYIEMRYDADKQEKTFAHHCVLKIEESNPSADLVASAYAIDKNGKGASDLGKFFTQQSELSCP